MTSVDRQLTRIKHDAIAAIKRTAVAPGAVDEIDFDIVTKIIGRALEQAAEIQPKRKGLLK